MAKFVLQNKMPVTKRQENPEYNNRFVKNPNPNPIYLEFDQRDQIYSYAIETTWQSNSSGESSGTVSTYTEGRVGTLDRSGDTSDTYSRNQQKYPDTAPRSGDTGASYLRNHQKYPDTASRSGDTRDSYSRDQQKYPDIASRNGDKSDSYSRDQQKYPDIVSRNGDKSDSYSRDQQKYPDIVSRSALSDSTNSTNTTYDKIVDTDFKVDVDVRVNSTNVKNTKTSSFSRLGRIIAILTVLVVLIIGGVLINMFVINKNNSQGSECNSIPKVVNGKIADSRSTEEYVTVTVKCIEGYQINGNETMTCTDGIWSAEPKCLPVECGTLPHVENGMVNGTSYDFNSTAEVVCETGFVQEGSGSGTITCQANGNWSSTSDCFQHPCGLYTPSEDLLPVKEVNSSYMTLCFKCKAGLAFMNGSDHCVTCQQGIWTGQPECEVQGSECNSIPKVVNGKIADSRSTEEYVTVTVKCIEGYQINGNETMTCTDGIWSVQPKCLPVECGTLPHVENGMVNGTSYDFSATAEVVCETGFVQEGSDTITCQADGNWSSTSDCFQHPCGLYTPSEDLLPVKEVNSSYMTLCFKCKAGLAFMNGSDHCVTCQQGIWTGQPECEVQGSECHSIPKVVNGKIADSRSTEEYVTVTVKCIEGYQINGNETMTCTDGIWSAEPKCLPVECGTLPHVENGMVNGTSYDFSSTAEVVCETGFVQEGSGTITCQADGNWSSTSGCFQHPCGIYTPSEDLLPVKEVNSSYMTLCFNCKAAMAFMNGSDHCVTCQQGIWTGQPECEVQGTIRFNPHQLIYKANAMVSLTCVVWDSPHWQSVGLARTDLQGSNVEPLYNILNTHGTIEIIQLSNISTFNVSYVTDTNGVTLIFKIDEVLCIDSGIYICGNIVGNIGSPDKVKSTNTSVNVTGQPDVPQWSQVQVDIISGSTVIFKCSGEIGDPKGYIDVESNFGGSFSVFLTTKITQDSNDVGSVNSFTDEKTNCGYKRTVVFSMRNVTSRFHQKRLRCVSRPFDYAENGQSAESDSKIIEVIPDNYCGVSDTIRRHPYHCDRWVICGNGKVAGVPAGCGTGSCFDTDIYVCYPCDQLGGCSITDIYIDGYYGWINEGNAATLICEVRDFQGLTDIVISKGNNDTVIAKLSEGHIGLETGMTFVPGQSNINGTHGQLTLRFESVQCQNEGTYLCFPVGSGKYSEDETSLSLRDVDGNVVC